MPVKPIPVAEMLFARTVQMELIVALVRKATRVILSEDVLVRIIICMTFPSLLPNDNNVTLLKLGGNLLQLLHQKKKNFLGMMVIRVQKKIFLGLVGL